MNIKEYLFQEHNIALNEQQIHAVDTINGDVLLLAVPGAGKTTVLVARIANMILKHNMSPSNILILTFNKESAKDMKQRFYTLFGAHIKADVHFSTIHSFCFEILRRYVAINTSTLPEIIDTKQGGYAKHQVIKSIYKEIKQEYPTEDDIENILSLIGYAKNLMLNIDAIKELGILSKEIHLDIIYKKYTDYKKQNHLMDFDDMLQYAYTALKKYPSLLKEYTNRYQYINVDEAQDTSKIQHEIIKLLKTSKNYIFMVGDEDQSIYGFRGAFPEALLAFSQTYPDAIILKMEQNFRSISNIITSANLFISHNKNRYPKSMKSFREEGNPIVYTIVEDAHNLYKHLVKSIKKISSDKSIAIIYRNNFSAIPIIDTFDRLHMSFYVKEQKTKLKSNIITLDILSFLSLHKNPSDIDIFSKVYYKLKLYITRKMFEYVSQNTLQGDNVFDILCSYPDKDNLNTGRISYIRAIIAKFDKLSPSKVLDLILYDFGYMDYLDQSFSKNNGMDCYSQKVATLKIIASNCKTIDDFVDRIFYVDSLIQKFSKTNTTSNITLTSAHSSKGLEFDHVFIIDIADGIFPSMAAINQYSQTGNTRLMEEEARLFYVAVTRAKNSLELISLQNLEGVPIVPSRFLSRLSDTTGQDIPIKIGFKLEHKMFGIGEVLSISVDCKLFDVQFRKMGRKTLAIEILENTKIIRIIKEEL